MFKSIGATLGQPVPTHDRQPVRRHSRLSGRCEGTFWRRTDRREVRRILLAAKKYELATRAPGRRNGALGHVAIEVLELLGNVVDFRTGRLEPAIAYMMQRLKRCRAAVVSALARLRAHGFADWLRRCEPIEREGPGPRMRQVSNAYRLLLPPRAQRLLGVQGQDVPISEDLAQEIDERAQAVAAMRVGLDLDELAAVEIDDGPLARALAALGRHVYERESAKQTETKSTIFIL